MKKTSPENANYNFSQSENDTLLIQLAGSWHIGQNLPSLSQIRDRIKGQGTIKRIAFESTSLESWDSSILLFLDRIIKTSKEKGLDVMREGIPQNILKLLDLAAAVPRKEDARTNTAKPWETQLMHMMCLDTLPVLRYYLVLCICTSVYIYIYIHMYV